MWSSRFRSVLQLTCTFTLFAAGYAQAQTVTTTDNLGETIVEAVTTNAAGALVTRTLQTLSPAAGAQRTLTTTDNLGETVIEVVSTNAAGVITTQIIQTLPAAASTTPANTGLVPQRTLTTTDNLGETIIEVVASDPVAGALTTEIIQTLPAQGPVGQPAASNNGQTVYFYTTTNALGQTTQLIATFTPTFATATGTPSLSSGTILNYSEWLSMVGTNTVQSTTTSRAGPSLLSGVLKYSAIGILSIVCGGLLVLS